MFSIYKNEKAINEILFKELKYMHFPFGYELNSAEPVAFEDELPNFLGGEPIKANSKIYFDELDTKENFCRLNYEITVSPEETEKFIRLLFLQMKLDSKLNFDDFFNKTTFNMVDSNRLEYYYNPGIPYYIETKRTVSFTLDNKKSNMEDVMKIELLFDE